MAFSKGASVKQTLFIRQLDAYFNVYLPDVRHLQAKTIASYADSFALFFQYMDDEQSVKHHKIDYKNFTPDIMDEFVLWLRKQRKYSAASVKQRLSAISSFMKFASRRDMAALRAYTVVADTESPKVTRSPFSYFTLEEMQILLHLPDPDKKIEKRDLALLPLFYDSGARAQEVCNLVISDIRFGSVTKVKLLGKKGKVREVPISKDVAELLKYHLRENRTDAKRSDPLFLSQLGEKMTTSGIRNLVEKYVEKARLIHPNLFAEKRYSPHSFRHSKAIHMVESDTQLIYIRNFLGHATTQSTEIYARVGHGALVKMLTERNPSNGHTMATTPVLDDKSQYPDFLDKARRR